MCNVRGLLGAYADIADASTTGDRKLRKLPNIPTPPARSLLDEWAEFEAGVPLSRCVVYVDGENVIKTFEGALDVSWPAGASADAVVNLVRRICSRWIPADAEWIVYCKRPTLARGSRALTFRVRGRKVGELDDVLCVAAACTRAKGSRRPVYLVSGDEMRWVASVRRLSSLWARIRRGPRGARSGSRLGVQLSAFADGVRNPLHLLRAPTGGQTRPWHAVGFGSIAIVVLVSLLDRA